MQRTAEASVEQPSTAEQPPTEPVGPDHPLRLPESSHDQLDQAIDSVTSDDNGVKDWLRHMVQHTVIPGPEQQEGEATATTTTPTSTTAWDADSNTVPMTIECLQSRCSAAAQFLAAIRTNLMEHPLTEDNPEESFQYLPLPSSESMGGETRLELGRAMLQGMTCYSSMEDNDAREMESRLFVLINSELV